jgi:hypothetical protein
MKPASLLTAAAALIRRIFSPALSDAETEAFLRARNARLIIQEADARTFHAMRVNPSTDVHAFGQSFNIRLRYREQMVHVRLEDKIKGVVLVDVALPDDGSAGTVNLNVANVQMRIEVDADTTRSDA